MAFWQVLLSASKRPSSRGVENSESSIPWMYPDGSTSSSFIVVLRPRPSSPRAPENWSTIFFWNTPIALYCSKPSPMGSIRR